MRLSVLRRAQPGAWGGARGWRRWQGTHLCAPGAVWGDPGISLLGREIGACRRVGGVQGVLLDQVGNTSWIFFSGKGRAGHGQFWRAGGARAHRGALPRCCFLDPLGQFWNLAPKSRWQDPPGYVWACLSTTHWSLHPSGARCGFGGIGDPWKCGLQKVLLARFWRKGRRRIRSAGMGERGWLCKGRSQVPCGFRREGGDGVGGRTAP